MGTETYPGIISAFSSSVDMVKRHTVPPHIFLMSPFLASRLRKGMGIKKNGDNATVKFSAWENPKETKNPDFKKLPTDCFVGVLDGVALIEDMRYPTLKMCDAAKDFTLTVGYMKPGKLKKRKLPKLGPTTHCDVEFFISAKAMKDFKHSKLKKR